MLTDAQIERYSRQIILPEVGGKGQEKILGSRVCVDAGGLLATSALFYLAAAGIGTIGIVGSQLASVFPALAGRQSAHQSVADVLTQLNPDCTVVIHTPEANQYHTVLLDYDLVLGSTDRLHDTCYIQRKPFVWATASLEKAQLFASRGDRPDWPCLRCLSVASLDEEVMGSLDAPYMLFLGAQLATEALKTVVNADTASRPKILECLLPGLHFTEQRVEKNPDCPLCSESPQ